MSKTLSLRSLLGSTLLPRNEAHILMAYVLDKHYQLPRSTLISRDEMELMASFLRTAGPEAPRQAAQALLAGNAFSFVD